MRRTSYEYHFVCYLSFSWSLFFFALSLFVSIFCVVVCFAIMLHSWYSLLNYVTRFALNILIFPANLINNLVYRL